MGAATTPRPTAPTPHFSNFPQDLISLERWVLWRYVSRGGSWTKVPFMPTGKLAKANDPATWSPFPAAKARYDQGGFDGIGFELGDGIVGCDLDWKAHAGPGVPPEAARIIADLASFSEYSPSARGAHVLVRGEWTQGLRLELSDGLGLEVYGSGRFFTMTGARIPDAPAELRENQAALDALAARYARTAPQAARAPKPARAQAPH